METVKRKSTKVTQAPPRHYYRHAMRVQKVSLASGLIIGSWTITPISYWKRQKGDRGGMGWPKFTYHLDPLHRLRECFIYGKHQTRPPALSNIHPPTHLEITALRDDRYEDQGRFRRESNILLGLFVYVGDHVCRTAGNPSNPSPKRLPSAPYLYYFAEIMLVLIFRLTFVPMKSFHPPLVPYK